MERKRNDPPSIAAGKFEAPLVNHQSAISARDRHPLSCRWNSHCTKPYGYWIKMSGKPESILNHPCPAFRVPHPSRIDTRESKTIRDPVKLGSYSVIHTPDGRQFDPSPKALTVLKLPENLNNVNFDLTEGYVSLKDGGKIICSHTPDTEPGLVELLRWILLNKSLFQLKSGIETQSKLHTDFVTYRGVLTKIMTMPYENRGDVLICASKFKGTIYMCLFTSDSAMAEEQNRDERNNQMSYGGFRFEKYITRPCDDSAQVESSDCKYEYALVVRTRLASHSLVYGAEMDCLVDARKAVDPQPRDFAEIKTAHEVCNARQMDNRRKFQMIRWWAQCYLIGIRNLICGNRNDSLTVTSIDRYITHDLPEVCKQHWTPTICLNFLDQFLSFMKATIHHDDPSLVYEFYWSSATRTVTCEITRGKRTILHDWYTRQLWTLSHLS